MAEDNKPTNEDEVPPVTPMVKQPAASTPAPVATPVIDQATLNSILARMNAQDEEIATLRASVDKNRLAAVDKAKKPIGLPTTLLAVMNGKIVVNWKSDKTFPTYIFNPTNPVAPVGENLKATYFFSDGSDSGIIDQTRFTQNIDRAKFEIVEGLKAIKDPETKEVTLHFVELITTDEDVKNTFVPPADFRLNIKYLNP